MNHVVLAALHYCFIVASVHSAQPNALTNRVRDAERVEDLPAHVIAPAGEITLFADFGDVRGDGVVLYLVNRTNRRLAFHAQDGDLYVKLEVWERAAWERAQSHLSSDCGNSYAWSPSLRPGEFFRFLGTYPSNGELRKVRYRMYEDSAFTLHENTPDKFVDSWFGEGAQMTPISIISNEGFGRVQQAQIQEARRDDMALAFRNYEALRQMALGIVRPAPSANWTRKDVVRELRKFPVDKTAKLLISLLEDVDPEVVNASIQSLAIIGPESAVAETKFQELLNDKNVARQSAAIMSLAEREMTMDVLTKLGELLQHTERQIRAAAIGALAMVCNDHPEVHAILIRHQDEPDKELREFLEIVQQRRFGWCCHSKVEPNNQP